MEEKKLTQEQVNEVNARVKEIIETFREGLCNSAAFDYANYWAKGMVGDGQMSEACKHVYDTKQRVVDMIDKEMVLVCREEESKYYQERRKSKEKIIDTILNIIKPHLKGCSRDEHHITQQAVNLAEFAIDSGEKLNHNDE